MCKLSFTLPFPERYVGDFITYTLKTKLQGNLDKLNGYGNNLMFIVEILSPFLVLISSEQLET